jgi:aminoglycoside 3-N-acetyltransferase
VSEDYLQQPPITRRDLILQLRELGIKPNEVLMVDCRLSALGYVIGGADSVLLALQDLSGPGGTLIALASWDHAPPDADGDWPSKEAREAYRRDPPAFDSQISACARYVGRLPERIRTWPGALRSDHPEASFVALGSRAGWLTDKQPRDHGYGHGSPLDKVLQADGSILMLGAPLETITMLHHAEELARVPEKRQVHYSAPVRRSAGIEWLEIHDIDTTRGAFPYEDLVDERDGFQMIGEEALANGVGVSGQVGESTSHLFPARELVRFAVSWMEDHFS